MFTSDLFPVKASIISADVVNYPRACYGLVFWTKLKLVKVDSEYTNVGIKNHPSMNGAYIWFILSQAGERKSSGYIERTVKKQEVELETLECKFDDLIRKVSYIESTAEKFKNSAE